MALGPRLIWGFARSDDAGLCDFPQLEAVALTLSTTAKNNVISLALAFSAFGADAGLVNAIAGPLVQLPILLGFVALEKSKALLPCSRYRSGGHWRSS